MLRRAIIITFLFLPLAANADFVVEIDANLGTGESEYDNSLLGDSVYDVDSSNLAAKIYFGGVDTNSSPYREAGFLSKNSSVSLFRDYEKHDSSESDFQIELMTTILEGRFVIPNSNIILGAGIINGKLKTTDSVDPLDNESVNLDGFLLSGGVYLTNNSALTLSYDKRNYEEDGNNDQLKTIHLNFKKIHSFGVSNHLVWHLDATKQEGDEDYDLTFIGGGLKFYVNQHFGVGASLEIGKDDYGYDEGSRALFTPEISYDFTENIGIYAKINSEAIDFDSDDTETTRTIQFGITGRF